MKTLFCILAAGALLATALKAEPIKLTRQQASDLFVALNRVEPGFSAENVVVAADNMNALRPFVEALDRGKVRAQREMDSLPPSEDRAVKGWEIRERIEAKGDEEITVELTRLEPTLEEVKAAKIAPRDIAPLRQFLRKK